MSFKWTLEIPKDFPDGQVISKWFRHPDSKGREATCWCVVVYRTRGCHSVNFRMCPKQVFGKTWKKRPHEVIQDFDCAFIAGQWVDLELGLVLSLTCPPVNTLNTSQLYQLGDRILYSPEFEGAALTVTVTLFRKGSLPNHIEHALLAKGTKQIRKSTPGLWVKRRYTDVTLVVKDGQLEAHKVVLMCSSPVFEAMFSHDFEEKKTSIVNLPDVYREVMEEALCFMYTGQANTTDLTVTIGLVDLAERYDLTDLKVICENALWGHLGRSSAFARDILRCAHFYGMADLRAYSESIIISSKRGIFSDMDLLKLAIDVNSENLKKIVFAYLAIGLPNYSEELEAYNPALLQELTLLKTALTPVSGVVCEISET